ncbi:MAG: GAF and ANTAR domain-containing protein [Deltaproteobacteria bacterium]|nr:GAF and ANTAR domain-containing protein [Deltaproteobacteria bacterium]
MLTKSIDKTIEALTLISEAITSDKYIEDVLRLIVIVTAEAMNSKVCSLWLLDENTQTLTIRATQSINREYLKLRVLKVGEGVVGHVAKTNLPHLSRDVQEDPLFKEKELARNMGLGSMISVPLSVGQRVIGVINCYTDHPHDYDAMEVNLLTTVANQAAVAIYNTELMVKTQVIREELEARKLVERAKDVLISRRKMTGEEAFRWLQKRSMDSRKSMREVAEAVLLADEL